MGRIILLLLIIATVVAIWYAFGPPSRKQVGSSDPRALGPDDDEDFLWQIEKERFKRRRAEQQKLIDEYGRPKPKADPSSKPESEPKQESAPKPESGPKPEDGPESPGAPSSPSSPDDSAN